jgi:hypothetical protein
MGHCATQTCPCLFIIMPRLHSCVSPYILFQYQRQGRPWNESAKLLCLNTPRVLPLTQRENHRSLIYLYLEAQTTAAVFTLCVSYDDSFYGAGTPLFPQYRSLHLEFWELSQLERGQCNFALRPARLVSGDLYDWHLSEVELLTPAHDYQFVPSPISQT